MQNSDDPVLLWMGGQPWRRGSGTDRSMALAMTRYARVLWVDPPASPMTRGPERSTHAPSVRPTLTEVNDRIMRLSTVALPGMTRALVRETTPMLTRLQIQWALRRLGVHPFAAVMCYLGDLLGSWGTDVLSVMYGTDDSVAGAELMGLSVRYLRAREHKCLTRADVVLTVSPELATRWASLGARPVVVRNGCWPEESVSKVNISELRELPRPIVGLAGNLSARIDIGVLETIADAGMSLLIAGELDPNWESERFSALVARPSVLYAGRVKREDLPWFLSSADVGITPYRDTRFNRASFPLKTLEYLGFGIPVVAANLSASRWLLGELRKEVSDSEATQILAIVNSSGDYITAIRKMLNESRNPTGDDRAQRCLSFAEKHSWHRRAEEFAAAIGLR